MKKFLSLSLSIIVLSTSQLLAEAPKYSVQSASAILVELQDSKYEPLLKEWLKTHHPAIFAKLSPESAETQKPTTEDNSLIQIASELNAAVADKQAILLDYYINTKCNDGWELFSMSEKFIVFKRVAKSN